MSNALDEFERALVTASRALHSENATDPGALRPGARHGRTPRRMGSRQWFFQRRLLLAVFVVVLTAGAVVAAASSGANNHQHAQQHVGRVSDATQSRVAQEFAVFGETARPSDQVPSGPFAGGDSRSIGPMRLPTLAWALIDGSKLCVTTVGAAACNSLTELARPDQLLIVGGGGHAIFPAGGGRPEQEVPQFLVGLVPNGSQAVTITWSDGTTITPTVARNGFEVQTDGQKLESVTWTTANGTTETEG